MIDKDKNLIVWRNGLSRVDKQILFSKKFLQKTEPRLIPYWKSYLKDNLLGFWGFCDENKKIIIPCEFGVMPRLFSDGLAVIQKWDSRYDPNNINQGSNTHYYGFINTEGINIIPRIYKYVDDFSNGYAIVGKEYNSLGHLHYGLINKQGKKIISCSNHSIERRGEYWRVTYNWTSKPYYINKYLKKLSEREIIRVEGKLKDEEQEKKKQKKLTAGDSLRLFHKYGTKEFMEKRSYEKTSCWFEHYKMKGYNLMERIDTQYAEKNFLKVKKESKWGLIDHTGLEIIPCKHDDILNVSEGMVRVINDNKFGFVGLDGNEIIPCKYYDANDFSNGLAFVQPQKYSHNGYINKQGIEFWEE